MSLRALSRPVLIASALGAGAAAAVLLLDRCFPPPLPASPVEATLVLARDGTPLRAFPAPDGVWRYPIAPEAVSPLYLDALLGYEDRRFHAHGGVDARALARAVLQWLRHGEIVSGGSTLTMQVARLIEPIPRTPLGKLKQMLRAWQIERRLDKRAILALYLARAPFGANIEGVEAASWAWLGKSARSLSHAEAALLAVLPQAPSRLRPDRHPAAARAARDKVLARLARYGIWSARELGEAALEPVRARTPRPPLAAALLAERLRRAAPRAAVITSTIDAGLQRMAERRVEAALAGLPPRSSAAALVVEHGGFEALAYVGSARFADPARLGHVDMVVAPRSPGSTLKPLIYGLALDDGLIHSASLLSDAPRDFGGYRPANFGDVFHGPVSASEALQRSLNVPAVELLARVTPARFAARLAHAGATLAMPRGAEPNLALALGGAATDLESLVGLHAAFGNGGLAGRVRYRSDDPATMRRVLSPGAAWIVRAMLTGNGRPGEAEAGIDTSRRVRVAWKTGTSYGYRDAWAVGSTARYSVGVWIGRPDGTPMPGHYGGVTALPLLFALIDALPRGADDAREPPPPPDVTAVDVCWPLGRPATETAPAHCLRRHRAWTLDGRVPPTLVEPGSSEPLAIAVLVDPVSGRRVAPGCGGASAERRTLARWPARLEPWLSAAERAAATAPPWHPACAGSHAPSRGAMRIDGAIDGSAIRRAPGGGAPVLALRALGAEGPVDWLVNGRWIGTSRDRVALRHRFAAPGEQRLVAIDAAGRYDRIVLRVLD